MKLQKSCELYGKTIMGGLGDNRRLNGRFWTSKSGLPEVRTFIVVSLRHCSAKVTLRPKAPITSESRAVRIITLVMIGKHPEEYGEADEQHRAFKSNKY
jgi:hypothetical protein